MADTMADTETDTTTVVAAPAQAIAPLPPDALIIVPVRDTVLFPGMVFPITIGRPKSIAAC